MRPLINGDLGVKVLKDWLALQTCGAVPPNAMYNWVDLNNVFLQGKVAMVVQWSDTARFSFDRKKWQSKVAGKVGWALVPGSTEDTPRGGVWIGRCLAISKQCSDPDKAWQVIEHVTSPEVSARAVNSTDTINDPFRKSHFSLEGPGAFPDKETYHDFIQTLEESLRNTNADLMIPGGWEYMSILDRYLGLALINQLSPEEALQKTAVEWEKLTEKYGRDQQIKYYQQWLKKLNEVQNK